MTNDRELMQMALDAMRAVSVDEHLCNAAHHVKKDRHQIDEPCPIAKRFNDIAEALRARLAQPEPKPVAWKDAPSKIYLQVCEESNCDQPFDSHIEISWCQDKINNSDISYVRADTAPPQREWQGLTDEEYTTIMQQADHNAAKTGSVFQNLRYAIEAKLKEKNT